MGHFPQDHEVFPQENQQYERQVDRDVDPRGHAHAAVDEVEPGDVEREPARQLLDHEAAAVVEGTGASQH